MQFVKKHYDKIILSFVLLLLLAAAGGLLIKVNDVQHQLEDNRLGDRRAKPAPFQPLDVSTQQMVIARFSGTLPVALSGDHNLLNPVPWQRRPDGVLVKIGSQKDIGPSALVVQKIDEKKLTISFEAVETNSIGQPLYVFEYERQADPKVNKKAIHMAASGTVAEFTLLSVEGPSQNPTSFDIKLTGEQNPIKITVGKPYERILGYTADLEYPPVKNTKLPAGLKAGDSIRLPGDAEMYRVETITKNDVTIVSRTQRRTTLKLEDHR